VTTGLPTDPRPGALGQRNTLIVGPSADTDCGIFAGVRAFAGTWFDPHGVIGLDASGFALEQNRDTFAVSSTFGGNPLLALRHLDLDSSRQDAFVITEPVGPDPKMGPVSGGIVIRSDSQLWGADANLLHAFCWARDYHLVGLAGLRYLQMDEHVGILTQRIAHGSSVVTFLGKPYGAGASEQTEDEYHGRDNFLGGQLGLRGEYFCNHFFLAASGKVALGRTEEELNILGLSTLQPPPVVLSGGTQGPRRSPHVRQVPAQTVPGGLYAPASDGGRLVNPDFGVVPELQLQAGVLLTPWLRATIGYDILYWSRVLRPGNQIDLAVNRQQVVTDPMFKAGSFSGFSRPLTNPSEFWAQGLTLGIEVNF
jgi:hypothetical protein